MADTNESKCPTHDEVLIGIWSGDFLPLAQALRDKNFTLTYSVRVILSEMFDEPNRYGATLK